LFGENGDKGLAGGNKYPKAGYSVTGNRVAQSQMLCFAAMYGSCRPMMPLLQKVYSLENE